jgi:hypothetical protein
MPFEINEAYLALIGTVFGGAGLKVVESVLGRGRRRDDLASSLRTELRSDNSELRAEVDKLEASVDEWRNRYYTLVAQLARRGIPIHMDGKEPQ